MIIIADFKAHFQMTTSTPTGCYGLVVRASAAQSEGHGFDTQPGNIKGHKKWYSLPSSLVLGITERGEES